MLSYLHFVFENTLQPENKENLAIWAVLKSHWGPEIESIRNYLLMNDPKLLEEPDLKSQDENTKRKNMLLYSEKNSEEPCPVIDIIKENSYVSITHEPISPKDLENAIEINTEKTFKEYVLTEELNSKTKEMIGAKIPSFSNNSPLWAGMDKKDPNDFHYSIWKYDKEHGGYKVIDGTHRMISIAYNVFVLGNEWPNIKAIIIR